MSSCSSSNVSLTGCTFTGIKDYGVLMVTNDATWGSGNVRLNIADLSLTLSGGAIAGVAVNAPVANAPYVGALDISQSTLNGGAAGVLVSGSLASANIHDNASTITGALIGVDVDGGSASLTQDNITANGTGVRVSNSGTLSSVTNNFITIILRMVF